VCCAVTRGYALSVYCMCEWVDSRRGIRVRCQATHAPGQTFSPPYASSARTPHGLQTNLLCSRVHASTEGDVLVN